MSKMYLWTSDIGTIGLPSPCGRQRASAQWRLKPDCDGEWSSHRHRAGGSKSARTGWDPQWFLVRGLRTLSCGSNTLPRRTLALSSSSLYPYLRAPLVVSNGKRAGPLARERGLT